MAPEEYMVNLRLVVLCAVFGQSVLTAQGRVSIPPSPKPDQTLQVATTQEFSVSASGKTMPAVAIVNKASVGFTQSHVRLDKDGAVEARLTIDRLETEETINGKTRTDDSAPLVGQTLTAVFDHAGKLTNLTVPKEIQRSASRLKALITVAHGTLSNVSPTTLGVGETVTMPWEVPVRLPGTSEKAPYQIQTTLTLRAIETRGKDRIARFDQRIESTGDTGDLKVTGAGTIELNIDRGFIAASSTEWTLTGSYRPKELPDTAEPSTVQATMKVATTITE